MPSWWGKFSSKDEKLKAKKESILNALRKLRLSSEQKSRSKSTGNRGRRDSFSEKAFSRVPSRSTSPSNRVSGSQSLAERPQSLQQLPYPNVNIANFGRTNSGISACAKPEFDRSLKPVAIPTLPKSSGSSGIVGNVNADADCVTAPLCSDTTSDSEDLSDSRLLTPLVSDCENGCKTAMSSPSSILPKNPTVTDWKDSVGTLKPANPFCILKSNQIRSISHKSTHVATPQTAQHSAISSAPNSLISSPCRSPTRLFGADPIMNCSAWSGKSYHDTSGLDSGQCSSAGSGYTSGQNSIGGDVSGQLFWPQSRCSPECSPAPSPRMISPGPSSRIQSGAVTPLHHRAGGTIGESLSKRFDGRQHSHPLPLPPVATSNTCPFSATHSVATSPKMPRSPGQTETPSSPGSRWKKGRLLGRGTYGQVYLGFDSETGEMCAMKEVALFFDDAKSKECAQQLGQEIALLSRLQHSNIVQYYGSETIDDKLYIYLEYVSGGSIYKLLQDYGRFGENAIRNYTQQILSGLAYLHDQNTVHRDIKGANILVDPCGRVKLADFGMAKHITGQPCPLSLKGSPYWMAPEVIKNSSGCNRAVDIWSLGCTVLEMATTKPPWSQYEGVAAMFKIGNSKELPDIPDHLSDEGKRFVRLCLQRDPSRRPTAAQLLDHPFVKNASASERLTPSPEPLERRTLLPTPLRSPGLGISRSPPNFEYGDVTRHHSKGYRPDTSSSASATPRITSLPISPNGSPAPNLRPPHCACGRMSPSPISTPLTASGSSTPLTGGALAIPYYQPTHSMGDWHEAPGIVPRVPSSFCGGLPYQRVNSDLAEGRSQPVSVLREVIASDSGQMALADHVSQQLLGARQKSKQFPYVKPSSAPTRCTGIWLQ